MNSQPNAKDIADHLLKASTIRERTEQIYQLVKEGKGHAFALDESKLDHLADYVIKVIENHYPQYDIPYHSRWRHIETGGINRAKSLEVTGESPREKGRREYDMVIVSILLDAGAGPKWSYEENGKSFSRSEGLGVASFHMFTAGLFTHSEQDRQQCTAQGLMNLSAQDIERGMQVSANNPLVGAQGRTGLLNRLGAALKEHPEVFGADGRLGLLFDHFLNLAKNNSLPAEQILHEVLRLFGTIWPGRESLAGINLGDTWNYDGLKGLSSDDSYVPFHKLSQWLSYSLIEPLEAYGIEVTDLDALTGLPEYRNGGLFIDGGVLTFKNPEEIQAQSFGPEAKTIVEWRALTVCLLDRLADRIRKKLQPARDWPLAKILQGGTWTAGREIAKSLRQGGSPPLNIESDGTVF